MGDSWYLSGGRIVDPAGGTDGIRDLLIADGRVMDPVEGRPDGCRTLDAGGMVVVPGLIDLHVHFREPGAETAETIASGSSAASRGGFTTVVAMPNTDPPVDSAERVSWQLQRSREADTIRVLPAACVTLGRAGRSLAPLRDMAAAGAVAFTDDGAAVPNEDLLRRAMAASLEAGSPIMEHALDPGLTRDGVMHEGRRSAELGFPGIPSAAETELVARDIRLAADVGCRLHIQHVSAEGTIGLIRAARQRGIAVSGEVTPHHLALTDADVRPHDANFKMSPPLRGTADREALCSAIAAGELQALATDHAPHEAAHKDRGFIAAPFGIVGLETAVAVTYSILVRSGQMSLPDWVRRWTAGPAEILGFPAPTLSPGSRADLAVLDLDTEWQIQAQHFASKSHNSPFDGRFFTGRAVYTFSDGRLVWADPTRIAP